MREKPTNELDELLKKASPEKMDGYFKDNKEYLADEKKAFYYFMKDTLESKNILLKDVYSFAGMSESYGSQILTMEKHTTNRDVIIRMCVVGHFTLEETNRALKLYGMSPLYAKDKRDANIIVAIHHRMYDLGEIDDLLEKQGFLKLSVKE